MAVEIERKFLLASDAWRVEVTESVPMVQVYIALSERCQIRLRRNATAAYLTVKGARSGLSRTEVETEVGVEFADAILAAGLFVVPPIVKTRHLVPAGSLTFEIDEYARENAGLIVAELELPAEDTEVPRPAWLGEDVSHEPRYRNLNLALHPYCRWSEPR
jgi:adenylate cyclase